LLLKPLLRRKPSASQLMRKHASLVEPPQAVQNPGSNVDVNNAQLRRKHASLVEPPQAVIVPGSNVDVNNAQHEPSMPIAKKPLVLKVLFPAVARSSRLAPASKA